MEPPQATRLGGATTEGGGELGELGGCWEELVGSWGCWGGVGRSWGGTGRSWWGVGGSRGSWRAPGPEWLVLLQCAGEASQLLEATLVLVRVPQRQTQ